MRGTNRYQMGPQHLDALDKIFGVLYKMSLPLTAILRSSSLFAEDDDTQEQLVTACTELLTVVVDITLTYQRRSRCTRWLPDPGWFF